jgi:hypothetical protein
MNENNTPSEETKECESIEIRNDRIRRIRIDAELNVVQNSFGFPRKTTNEVLNPRMKIKGLRNEVNK